MEKNLGIILVGSEICRDLSLGETSVGLGETLTCLGETLHGRNSLWAKPVVTETLESTCTGEMKLMMKFLPVAAKFL